MRGLVDELCFGGLRSGIVKQEANSCFYAVTAVR